MKENKKRDDNVVGENLKQNYHNIDVLILDDIQNIRKAQHTMDFFFETFEYLVSQGKQIVLAADEPPSNLGMPERIESRIGSGLSVSIETPTLEFKRVLVTTFYDRFKKEGATGTLTEDDLIYIAEQSGGNIRMIRAFVQECLFKASQYEALGEEITQTDIAKCASERWQKKAASSQLMTCKNSFKNNSIFLELTLSAQKEMRSLSFLATLRYGYLEKLLTKR